MSSWLRQQHDAAAAAAAAGGADDCDDDAKTTETEDQHATLLTVITNITCDFGKEIGNTIDQRAHNKFIVLHETTKETNSSVTS